METTDCCESLPSPATSRRALLLGGASFAAWAYLPKFARAADGRDPRLIVVILRGALDGLATIAPTGDPDYAGLHGSIALSPDGPHAAMMLDSFFALHPAMPEFARMYKEKRAAVVHAVATPYRLRSNAAFQPGARRIAEPGAHQRVVSWRWPREKPGPRARRRLPPAGVGDRARWRLGSYG